MPRLLVVAIAFGALAAACQPLSVIDSTTTSDAGTFATDREQSLSSDRIVVSTVSGAIVVFEATGKEVARIDPPDGHVYRQPTWLDHATAVFSDIADTGDHALVAFDAENESIVWRAEMETPPFYFAPAPANSPHATTSLRNDPSGSGLISELVDHSGRVTAVSQESPFYTSWSPEGEQLAIHIAGRRLDVRRNGATDTLLTDTGLFQAPVWVARGLVTLRTVSEVQRLTLWNGGSFTDLAEVEGPAGFVASGDLVAIQATVRPDTGSIAAGLRSQSLPAVPGGRLVVLDLSTGALQAVSGDLALVFQWDQKGESLLYATLGDEPATLVWNTWSSGRSAEIASFTIQPAWFGNLVPFFDQYAQSVQFWSPSGTSIAYPAIVGSDPVVIVESLEGADRIILPDATWSAWAPSG